MLEAISTVWEADSWRSHVELTKKACWLEQVRLAFMLPHLPGVTRPLADNGLLTISL